MRAAVFAIVASIPLFGVGCHNTCQNGCSECCDSCEWSDYGNEANGDFHGYSDGGRFGRALSARGHLGHGQMGDGHMGHGRKGHGPTRVVRLPHGYMYDQMYGHGGPPSPTVVYPYYTTRAPRDFLMANPPSIGP